MICGYGCGQEAKFPPTKGRKKGCCSKYYAQCPEIRKKNSIGQKGKGKKKGIHLGQISWNKNLTKETNEVLRKIGEKVSKKKRGIKSSIETRRKQSNSHKIRKRTLHSKETKRKIGISKKGKTYEEIMGKERAEQRIRDLSNWMKSGHAVHMCSCITDDSEPENNLFLLTCKVLPRPIHKYSIYRGKKKRNYTVDIADSSLGIILEYDGYYHFNTKKAIAYHKKRQQEIEEDGWKFIRYNIFQPLPTLEQLKQDIQKVLKQLQF